MKLEFGLKGDQVFKLLSLELWNHPILGDINLSFVDESEEKYGPYTTVIIGPNGTGKSSILRLIIDVFRELETLTSKSQSQEIVKCGYKLPIPRWWTSMKKIRDKRLSHTE